jgi:hypothetical protein
MCSAFRETKTSLLMFSRPLCPANTRSPSICGVVIRVAEENALFVSGFYTRKLVFSISCLMSASL